MNVYALSLPAIGLASLLAAPLHAGIDSGGVLDATGSYINHSSIGSPFSSGSIQAGDVVSISGSVRSVDEAVANFLDSDKDGLSDANELTLYNTDPLDQDTDGDGINDYTEIKILKTNPLLADTDGDGLNDGQEVSIYQTDPLDDDSDDDGLNDYDEVTVHGTDPFNADTDDDQLSDYEEVTSLKTDPLKADTDDDGLNDNYELLTSLTDPNASDTDKDGLSDGSELSTHNTNPLDPDSDDDSFSDGLEAQNGGNPLVDDSWYIRHITDSSSSYGLYELSSIKDLRIGSVMLEVEAGSANLIMELQETTDLLIWPNESTSIIEIPVDADEDTKFFRFSMPE